jgi:protein-tyrosine phosphatase
MTRVLLVCMANVCRSPTALAVARQRVHELGLAKWLEFDSAGTHVRQAGARMDPRAASVLAGRQYKPAKTRSRQIIAQDFQRFDLIVAMDEANLLALQGQCAPQHHGKLRLLLEFAPELGLREVPDPYYGSLAGFERVLDLCEAGLSGLIRAQSRAP